MSWSATSSGIGLDEDGQATKLSSNESERQCSPQVPPNNNNNLIFILRKIHVNMIKCALHEGKLSTLISYPK